MKTQIDPHIYRAAFESAVLVNRSTLGMLKITGETRLDLMNRMSTQAVVQLQPGQGAATILTTDIGRIIDRLILYAGSSTVYVITGENNADNIARYLMRFVFFMDDFHLQDLSEETAIWGIYGPRAKEYLQEGLSLDAIDLPLHHWQEVAVDGTAVYLHRTDPLYGDGYFITSEAGAETPILQALRGLGVQEADETAFDFLRIQAGLPQLGHELTQDYIPLEAGLWDDVSFNKGCYIGQEIIARMESRGKLAKKLTRLQSTILVNPGDMIQSGKKNAGTITSSAVGPDGVVALGYVKTNFLAPGTVLQAGDSLLQPVVQDPIN